ncbi:MAG TPA: hypothetical protein DHV28_07795 [Ignavibacteriales bacterium]|nr:hypothetical protein [Ignavibacteriales bacterium]
MNKIYNITVPKNDNK